MAKYNSRIKKEICSYLETGMLQKDAALLSGVSEDTYYTWKKDKSEFSESVRIAILKYKHTLITSVNVNAVKDGKLGLEVLSRRWPKEFGKDASEPENDENKEVLYTWEQVEKYMRMAKKIEQGNSILKAYQERKAKGLIPNSNYH